MKNLKEIPEFNSEESEKEFWENESSEHFVDWEKGKKVIYPNLQKSNKTISIRLPEDMLFQIKQEANKIDVPYQSLMKIILSKGLQELSYLRKNMSEAIEKS
jgi:predicted DNA binding CopG/RHH family protein